jgi:predicted nucleic acid-binding protein
LFGRSNAPFFRPFVTDTSNLLVPTISLCEVIRYFTRTANREAAQEAAARMLRGTVAELDPSTAHLAARLGLKHNLPLADSIVYATAQSHGAKLYTQDADFEKLSGVKYIRKK